MNTKQDPLELDKDFKSRFEDAYKDLKFSGGSYILWIQKIRKRLIRGANTVSAYKIRAVIDKFKVSAYIYQADPTRYGTTRKELEVGA